MPTPQSHWLNVKADCGAKGDGVTDDVPEILACVKRAGSNGANNAGGTVYFPPSSLYVIGSQLVLPQTSGYVTLFFDAPVKVRVPIEIRGSYTLHGGANGGGAFAAGGRTLISPAPGVNPTIHIQSQAGVLLENLGIAYPSAGADGILIDNASSSVKLKNVGVWMEGNNVTGIPLKIAGGFGYVIEDSGFNSYGNAPSISYFSDPVFGDTTGIFTIKNIFIVGGGIHIENTGGGGVDGVSIDGGLMEGSSHPFLTLRTGGNASGISGVELHHLHFSDSASPAPPLIDATDLAQHIGPPRPGYIRNVIVMNCFPDGPRLVTGDTIWGLEVWSAGDWQPASVAQPDHYIYHGPNGIKDTMPRIQ